MAETSDPDSKVLFRVPVEADSDDESVETLWARNLGDNKYKLDNFPFFAYSVSYGDIVYAPFDETEGFPNFSNVIEKSGNRTIRIIFEPAVEKGNSSSDALEHLVKLGCDYEGANSSYLVLNIPPSVNFDVIVDYLIEINAEFEYADPSSEELDLD